MTNVIKSIATPQQCTMYIRNVGAVPGAKQDEQWVVRLIDGNKLCTNNSIISITALMNVLTFIYATVEGLGRSADTVKPPSTSTSTCSLSTSTARALFALDNARTNDQC